MKPADILTGLKRGNRTRAVLRNALRPKPKYNGSDAVAMANTLAVPYAPAVAYPFCTTAGYNYSTGTAGGTLSASSTGGY